MTSPPDAKVTLDLGYILVAIVGFLVVTLCAIIAYFLKKGPQIFSQALNEIKKELCGLRQDLKEQIQNYHNIDVRLVKQESLCKTCQRILWDRRSGKERREDITLHYDEDLTDETRL
jgi:hypothetical protein